MRTFSIASVMAAAALLWGCSGSRPAPGSAFESYDQGNVTVIGGQEETATGSEPITVSSPVGEGECVEVSDNLCVPVETDNQAWCEREGGPTDLVVVDGEVVEVICYPPPDNNEGPTEVITTEQSGSIDVMQNANRTAVTFDPATNGQPITGDVSIDGNQVSFYGNGPENTIIEGNVTVEGNNVRLRGMTITGDLSISKNTTAVVLCTILGNVVFADESANGSIFVNNDVFGDFYAPSNGDTLTGNDVLGIWTVTGHNNVCDGNYAFADANQDEVVQDEERGDALACP